MKRFLLLAAVVGGLTLGGFASTAKADHGGRGVGGLGGWGHGSGGYGYHHAGCGPRYAGFRTFGYGYSPYVTPGFYAAGPGFAIGVNSGFGCGNPYNSYGSAVYPPANYGW